MLHFAVSFQDDSNMREAVYGCLTGQLLSFERG